MSLLPRAALAELVVGRPGVSSAPLKEEPGQERKGVPVHQLVEYILPWSFPMKRTVMVPVDPKETEVIAQPDVEDAWKRRGGQQHSSTNHEAV